MEYRCNGCQRPVRIRETRVALENYPVMHAFGGSVGLARIGTTYVPDSQASPGDGCTVPSIGHPLLSSNRRMLVFGNGLQITVASAQRCDKIRVRSHQPVAQLIDMILDCIFNEFIA